MGGTMPRMISVASTSGKVVPVGELVVVVVGGLVTTGLAVVGVVLELVSFGLVVVVVVRATLVVVDSKT